MLRLKLWVLFEILLKLVEMYVIGEFVAASQLHFILFSSSSWEGCIKYKI